MPRLARGIFMRYPIYCAGLVYAIEFKYPYKYEEIQFCHFCGDGIHEHDDLVCMGKTVCIYGYDEHAISIPNDDKAR